MVQELVARGAVRVYSTGRSPQPGPEHGVIPLVLDVTDADAVAEAAEKLDDVSIVVNNAGILLSGRVLDAPIGDIRAELETNLFGILNVSRAFAHVLARQRPAALVNVLSAASWAASGRSYDLSKAAAWSATNSMRLQLLEHGITVTALHVGPMDTEAVAAVDIPKSDPRDIARQTVDAIIAGRFEVLADQRSRDIKARLCQDLTEMYPQLAR
jgi:NAD(P)-dependent dehydrogenase (short-subunit alcohol dehydrogenase family)